MPGRGFEPPCLAAQRPKRCVSTIPPSRHEAILPVNLTYSYNIVEYARPNMSSSQDPITVQKEALPNSSRPFSGGYSVEQKHDPVVHKGTLTFSTPSLSPGTSADPLRGPRTVLQREIDRTRVPGTPSQEEEFSQATGRPLKK